MYIVVMFENTSKFSTRKPFFITLPRKIWFSAETTISKSWIILHHHQWFNNDKKRESMHTGAGWKASLHATGYLKIGRGTNWWHLGTWPYWKYSQYRCSWFSEIYWIGWTLIQDDRLVYVGWQPYENTETQDNVLWDELRLVWWIYTRKAAARIMGLPSSWKRVWNRWWGSENLWALRSSHLPTPWFHIASLLKGKKKFPHFS